MAKLYARTDTILKKIGEEATETVIAAKDGDKTQLVYEMADLWFHSMVLLAQQGLHPDDVLKELARREGLSGLVKKAGRRDERLVFGVASLQLMPALKGQSQPVY